MKKSVGVNAILNAIKTVLGIAFPLITYPYVSRVLGVENIGVYNFSASVISYFLLIAALGVSTYAVREGAGYRYDKDKISKFINELFTINIISTIISYVLLVGMVFSFSKLKPYTIYIMILSFEIIATTLGASWICNIFEDFWFITIRTVIMQVVSLVLTFVLVKSSNDLNIYIVVVVIANSGSNLLNFFYVRKKYCKLRITKDIDWKRHLKPIITIFSTTIAITIYVNSDVTMLGIIKSDYEVGLYSTAVKIYTIVKNLLSAVLVVLIPRFSILFWSNKKIDISTYFSKVFMILTSIMLPVTIGLFMLSKDIIYIISGEKYLQASNTLRILSIAVLFSLYSFLYIQCILIPMKKEKIVFLATCISATINVILNVFFIPYWGINAAAFTTLFAEIVTCVISFWYSRKYVNHEIDIKNFLGPCLGCFGICLICILFKTCENYIMRIGMTIGCSIIEYCVVNLIFNGRLLLEIRKSF